MTIRTNERRAAEEVFEDGVLVGRMRKLFNRDGKQVTVFIPRREEDVEADRVQGGTERSRT